MTKPKQKNKHRARSDHKGPKESSKNHEEAKEETCRLPYRVKISPIMGRYLEATRDLAPGEELLKEAPLVVGPSQDSAPICIGCYISMDFENAFRCPDCSFPLCSSSCPGKGIPTGHTPKECSQLASTPLKTLPTSSLKRFLDVIAPLRCLLKRENDVEAWEKINEMEHHTETRKKIESIWDTNQKCVVDVIRNDLGLLQYEEEVIHRICGVLEVNAFEVGSSLRAIYPNSYLFAHCCLPNTRHSDDAKFNIAFRASTHIPKNGTLYVTYSYILQGTQKRRQHLRDTKFFDCECSRCRDPTECGTNISAFRCSMCSDGLVLSSRPLDPEAPWKCVSKDCVGFIMPGSAVLSATDRIFSELNEIDGNDIAGYEEFLVKHSKTLHENHFLCLSAMHCLFLLYGKIDGYLINNLNDQQLARKAELCKALLAVFNKLDPGFSKQRGLILYEQHAALMVLLQRNYTSKKVGKLEMKSTLKEVIKCLEESKKLLSVEPTGSQEEEMSKAAEEALEKLTTWRALINKM